MILGNVIGVGPLSGGGTSPGNGNGVQVHEDSDVQVGGGEPAG